MHEIDFINDCGMFCRRYVDLIDLTGDSPSDDSASELPAITMDSPR